MSFLHAIGSGIYSFIGGPAVFVILVVLTAAAICVGVVNIAWAAWRDRRAGQPTQPMQAVGGEQPLWDRARLTAEEYTTLAAIEAEEKAAEQERRDRARGAGTE